MKSLIFVFLAVIASSSAHAGGSGGGGVVGARAAAVLFTGFDRGAISFVVADLKTKEKIQLSLRTEELDQSTVIALKQSMSTSAWTAINK